jgi:hypothetical protein
VDNYEEQLARIKQQLEDCREENNRKLKTAYEDCANIKQGLEKKVQKMTLAAAVTGTVVGGEVLSKVTETVEQVTGLTDTLGAAPKPKGDPYALDLDWITPEIEMPDDNVTGGATLVEGDQDSIFDAKEGMEFGLYDDGWASIPNPLQELETEADLTQAPEREMFMFGMLDEDYSIAEGFGYFIARAEVEELVEELAEEEELIEAILEEEELLAIEQPEEKELLKLEPLDEYIPPPPVFLQSEPEAIVVAEPKFIWALPFLAFLKPRRRRNG